MMIIGSGKTADASNQNPFVCANRQLFPKTDELANRATSPVRGMYYRPGPIDNKFLRDVTHRCRQRRTGSNPIWNKDRARRKASEPSWLPQRNTFIYESITPPLCLPIIRRVVAAGTKYDLHWAKLNRGS